MADISEIGAVWKAETKRATRSGRGIAVMVLFLFAETLTLGVGGCINVNANRQFDEVVTGQGASPEDVRTMLVSKKREFLKNFSRNSEATVEVIAEVPLVLLLVFFATILFIPLLIALMGFDQISAEVGPKSIRFLVVRAQRSSVLLGKYLSQLTVLAVLLLVCIVAMVGVTRWLNSDFQWAQCFRWAVKMWGAAMTIGCAYAALTTLCSAVTRAGPLSLFLNIILLFLMWFAGLLLSSRAMPDSPPGLLPLEPSPIAYGKYLLPSHFEGSMLSPAPLEWGAGLIALLGFTGIFLGLAQLALDERDV
jgi:ABC-type transport system involved in multi-copper enzyme maturation permease subunit